MKIFNLSVFYHENLHFSADFFIPDVDITVLEQNCEEGHARSCIDFAAYQVLLGKAVTIDFTYYERACDLGDYMGCFRMGEAMQGTGDKEAARKYFRLSCEMGHLASCLSIEILDMERED